MLKNYKKKYIIEKSKTQIILSIKKFGLIANI